MCALCRRLCESYENYGENGCCQLPAELVHHGGPAGDLATRQKRWPAEVETDNGPGHGGPGVPGPVVWRHTCATHLVQKNANLRHVQDLLSHGSLATTERYLRLTITDLNEAHARFHPREQRDD